MKNLILVWILLLIALFQATCARKHEHHHHRDHHHRSRNRGALREYNHRYHHANNEFGKRQRDLDDNADNPRRSTRHGSPFMAEKNGKRRIVEIDIGEKSSARGRLPLNSASMVARRPSLNSTRRDAPTVRPSTTSRTITTEAPEVTIPCTSSKNCKPGSCCQNRNGKEKVCMELNVPSGKQCWNYCMCAEGLVCFYKQGIAAEEKDKSGVCKIPQEGDLSQGNYMKP